MSKASKFVEAWKAHCEQTDRLREKFERESPEKLETAEVHAFATENGRCAIVNKLPHLSARDALLLAGWIIDTFGDEQTDMSSFKSAPTKQEEMP